MIKNMHKMKIISLLISLFGIIKTKALECVSVVNQKCMPEPKILDVNEGVGEGLFYPYIVLVNKCSGSCNTFDNPMAKLCVPNVIKRVNMQVYNFLMRLNETRNVLWHESCKCICKLNSSVCNDKQIWNDDTCRCDCNEDFAGVVGCDKGYTWNPSTCECQCEMWCKSGQYLDHKNCFCKNKLIGRLIKECTSVINETMINNNIFLSFARKFGDKYGKKLMNTATKVGTSKHNKKIIDTTKKQGSEFAKTAGK